MLKDGTKDRICGRFSSFGKFLRFFPFLSFFRKMFVLKDGTTGFVLWTFPVYRWSLVAYSEMGEICARAAVFLDISG